MKPTLVFAVLLSLIISITSCGAIQRESFDIDSIKSYQDIPGVTAEEIAAIEAIRETRDHFSYGSSTTKVAFVMPDGTYAGFTPSFCELLSSLFGIGFNVEFCEWDDMINRLNRKSLDFTGELTATPERSALYYMTHSIAEHPLSLFTNANTKEIQTEAELTGLRLGFLEGTVTPDTIRATYPIPFEVVDVPTYTAAAEMLESGGIDAFVDKSVVDPIFAEYDYIRQKDFFLLVHNPVSLSTANPDLQPIISVVNKYLLAGGIDKLSELYQEEEREYAKYKLHNSFSEEELAYLDDLAARNAKISVAYENENYPVSFYNEQDREFQGFAVDILSEVSRLTGIEFEAGTTKDTPWPEMLEKLKTGEVSMLTQLLYTDARKSDYIWSSIPYSSSYYALLSKLEYPELASYQVIRSTVGIIDQTGHADMYNAWFPDSASPLRYPTHEDALTALEKGEIDLLMASEYTLLFQTNYREKPGYKANIRFGVPMDSVFGFNKGEVVLRSIIDKALPYINTDTIVRGWTGRVFDYSRKYAAKFTDLLTFSIAILFFVVLYIVYLLRKNKRFSRDLERKTATLSTIFTSIPDLLYSKDTDCNYTSCNSSFENFAGRKEADIVGKNALEIFTVDEEMAHRFVEGDIKVMRENITIIAEDWYTYPSGERKLYESIKTPLIQDGTIVGMLGISRDMTEHKAIEEAAQAASRSKSAFLAHMSHEIRTPMNAITGMTQLILREDVPTEIYEYVMSIKHASSNLLSLINDILDFSKIEAGSLEIVPVEYSFGSLINDVLIIARMRVSEKAILFTANIDCNIPGRLIGDESRIRQIFLNILTNAAKYTNEGFVSLNVTSQLIDDAENTVIVTIEVSDSGVGIKEQDMEKLFGDFARFDRVKNKGVQGTGLGLAITKSLCEAMGGDISARSEYGVGSTFTVKIPQRFTAYEKFACVSEPENKPVLIYEPRSIYADSIARSLNDLGVRCAVAGNLPELLGELQRFPYPFIFVSYLLSDCVGPIINQLGLDTKLVLLMELGETPESRNVRTIAMPIHAASIANILNDVESNVFFNENGEDRIRFIAPTASILLVDDVNTNLKVAEGLMAPFQMQVDVCRSGAESIKYAQKNRYDIIFMDHMMPEMDGIEAANKIRSLEDESGYFQRVPIIALTANAISGMKETFMQNGMNDFLAKPIDTAKLNSMLEKWIPDEKKQKFRGTRQEQPVYIDTTIQIEGIDVGAGIAMTGGVVDNYLSTLSIFNEEGVQKIANIRECLENGDIKLYTTYVHALKSASASIGASQISDYAQMLEMAGSMGDTVFIREHTESFISELETLLQNIGAVTSNNQDFDEAAEQNDPEALRIELARLKEALDNMDVREADSILASLGTKKWNRKAGETLKEISRNILLFNLNEAIALFDELLKAYGQSDG